MKAPQSVFGIDLGTTFSACARVEVGTMDPELMTVDVPRRGPQKSLPSVVLAELGTRGLRAHVGQSAHERYLTTSDSSESPVFIERAKREIGNLTRGWPVGEENRLDPVDVSAIILKKIRQTVETEIGQPLGPTVVTHPRDFSISKKDATFAAAEAARLDLIDTINEPEAAAYMYFQPGEAREPGIYVVFDLGGGTLDIALMDVPMARDERARIIDGVGVPALGGVDWDKPMLELIKESARAATGVQDLWESLSVVGRAKLADLAREFKHQVRGNRRAIEREVELPFLDGVVRVVKLNVERAAWEERCRGLVDRCEHALDEAMARHDPQRVVRVLPVGGSTRLEMIRSLLQRRFPGRVKFDDDNFPADFVVAQGAARFASLHVERVLSKTTTKLEPRHRLAESCAIETTLAQGINVLIEPDGKKELFPIVHRGTAVPTTQSLKFDILEPGDELTVTIYEGEPGPLLPGARSSAVVTLPSAAKARKGDTLTITVDVKQSSRFSVAPTHDRSGVTRTENVGASGERGATVVTAASGSSKNDRQKKIDAVEVL